MSSYYPSFSYKGFNSLKDKHLIVVAFDADQGEMDTFLDMEPIYTEKYDGSKRIDYGAKFTSVAVIKISVMKMNQKDFTIAEVRDFLRWSTGSRQNSYLDLLVGDDVKFSFLGRVTKAYQQKIDSRTIGLSIEFTSVSPWAYSPIQYVTYYPNQLINVDDGGVIYKTNSTIDFSVDQYGTVYNDHLFRITENGIMHINDSPTIQIDNQTDDLYTPIYLNTVFENETSDTLIIKNETLDEETKITSISANEVITLSADQFILSDKTAKIFGNSFNYVWPRLAPGINNITIDMNGSGNIEFTYRYPIKIGDCTIDLDMLDYMCGGYYVDDGGSSDNNIIPGKISWENIINTPITLGGYGVTDAYTTSQIDQKFEYSEADCINRTHIDESDLNNMLKNILD